MELLQKPHPKNLKALEEVMIEPDGVRRKSVVDGIHINEGEEVIDGLLTDTEWDEEENETVSKTKVKP